MEVEQAKAFLVLAEELHFGRAADRLNIAQPPLSRTIKQLERQLKVELFIRSTRSVELSAAGAALVEPARKLVDAAAEAVRVAQAAASGSIGVVTLGFAGASIHHSVGRLAREVMQRYPGLDLQLHSAQFSPNGLHKVLGGELDAAIGRWDFLPAEISSVTLSKEELVVAVPTTHRLARAGATSVKMEQLANEEWIVLPGGFGSALRNRFNALARRGGFVPTIRATSPDSWTLLVLVGAGMGVAVTLDSVQKNVSEQNVHYLTIEDPERFIDVQVIWREDNNNPALAGLLETIADYSDGTSL